MAQYDVYENPSAAQRDAFPYFVVLQSEQLREYSTRLVMPLSRMPAAVSALPRRLAQTVVVRGERLHLAPQLTAALPRAVLQRPVDSLRDASAVLLDALDAVISGV